MGSCRPFFTAKIKGQPVVTADGRAIDSADVLGPPERRKKLVVMGDTETTAEHVREAEPHGDRSNLLERDAAMALDYGYLTAAKAAELAATAGVKQLVLTHISAATPTRRYWRRRQKYSRTPEWRPTSIDWRSEALPMMSTKDHVDG